MEFPEKVVPIARIPVVSNSFASKIDENDRYKIVFTVPFGHYEWNVMSFGLKNAPSEFQNIMNDIFTSFTYFTIVYECSKMCENTRACLNTQLKIMTRLLFL